MNHSIISNFTNSGLSMFSTNDFIFLTINLAFSTYLFVSSMVYNIKIEYKKSKTKEKRNLNILCSVNVLCAFVSVLKDLPMLYMANKPGLFCLFVVNIAGRATYFLGLSTAFGVLWYRQHKLYSDPKLTFEMSKICTAVHFLLLISYLLLLLAVMVAFSYETDWLQPDNTCVQKFTGKINMVAMTTSYCVITIFCYVVLFMFFAQQLGSYVRNKKVAADLRRMLRRLSICTLGCCASSLQFNLLLVLVSCNRVRLYLLNFAELDLIITSVCLTGTFSNWKQRLCPFRLKIVELEANGGEKSSIKYCKKEKVRITKY